MNRKMDGLNIICMCQYFVILDIQMSKKVIRQLEE